MCIPDYIVEFNAKYNDFLSNIDGINVDCSIYSYLLYKFLESKGEFTEI